MPLLQFDEITRRTQTGNFFRFDKKHVFMAETVAIVDEDHNTVQIPSWLMLKEGLEGYEL